MNGDVMTVDETTTAPSGGPGRAWRVTGGRRSRRRLIRRGMLAAALAGIAVLGINLAGHASAAAAGQQVSANGTASMEYQQDGSSFACYPPADIPDAYADPQTQNVASLSWVSPECGPYRVVLQLGVQAISSSEVRIRGEIRPERHECESGILGDTCAWVPFDPESVNATLAVGAEPLRLNCPPVTILGGGGIDCRFSVSNWG
jgi:hypothetical protein